MIGEGTLGGATGLRRRVAIGAQAVPRTAGGLAILSFAPSLAAVALALALPAPSAWTVLCAAAFALLGAVGLQRVARRLPEAHLRGLGRLLVGLGVAELAPVAACALAFALRPDWSAALVVALACLTAMHALARLTASAVVALAQRREDDR